MAPISPGKRPGPLRKARQQTQTEKAHRYEPFNKRIAKLKIDPVHKVQKSRLKENSDDISQSHFRSALEEWSELNLTTTFTSFFTKVSPLSESLPQLLHHRDQITNLLLEHIAKQDSLALEALLSLLAHLAHDLGQEFEKYFAQTVVLVAKVFTIQDDPAVVEACFTCLAWMYKYLSRLLVQDLRPLLDILLPYFSVRKEYIRRFTAESLAFLLRKAAVLYPKNQKPLELAVDYILRYPEQHQRTEDVETFAESSMVLLADSAIGVDAGLHSSATELFNCVYQLVCANYLASDLAVSVLEGMTVNLIHRTDATGFQPLFDLILENTNKDQASSERSLLSLRLLLIAVGTRGGSRVEKWSGVFEIALQKLTELLLNAEQHDMFLPVLSQLVVAAVHHSPLDQLLPMAPKLTKAIIDVAQPSQFFSFCESVARINKSRFQDLLLPHLQQYIAFRWNTDGPGMTVLLDGLHDFQIVHSREGTMGYFIVSPQWEEDIQRTLLQIASPNANSQLMQYLLLARSIHFPKTPALATILRQLLLQALNQSLAQKEDLHGLESRLSLGWGFQILIDLDTEKNVFGDELCAGMLTLPKESFQLLPCVEAFAQVASQTSYRFSDHPLYASVVSRLLKNMLNSSTSLRKSSLDLLARLSKFQEQTSSWLFEVCALLQEILNTRYTIANARQLSMLLRKLPNMFKDAPKQTTLSTLIPYFALGLLPDYHDQLRKDTASALNAMMHDPKTEELVLEVMRDWLYAADEPITPELIPNDEISGPVSPFVCTRLNAVRDIYLQSTRNFIDAPATIRNRAEAAHTLLPSRIPVASRLIALSVLIEMPIIAEKRSKILVPAFLAAQKRRVGHGLGLSDESLSVNTLSPDIEERGWTLRERKLFLQLISLFNNPRVLYRANEVHDVLLELLTNGDLETRKMALQALLRWNTRALVAHQEALLRVAEEKQTTSELGSMLSHDDDSATIKSDSRSEVLPVLLRLVFGQLIGRVGLHGSHEAKRKALLRLLFRMAETEVYLFLKIALGRLRDVDMSYRQGVQDHLLTEDLITMDQQYGFLRMVTSMLDILQTQFSPFGSRIIDAVVYCTARASHQINGLAQSDSAPALLRNIRRSGLQCLTLLFEHCENIDLASYMTVLQAELIKPRMPSFANENTQGVSALLKLFSTWARSANYVQYLQSEDNCIFAACWGLLSSENAKSIVKAFILGEIVNPILNLAERDVKPKNVSAHLISNEASSILDSVSALLQQNPTKDLLLVTADGVRRLATHVSAVNLKEKVVELLIDILREPNQRLPPHVKGQTLKAIDSLAEQLPFGKQYAKPFFELLSGFLDFFRDVPNRKTAISVLGHIANDEHSLLESVSICQNLNAYSTTQLEDIDHDQQTQGFNRFHEILLRSKSSRSLLPVLHNLVFLIRTSEDHATRGNALSCLKHAMSLVTADDTDHQLLRKVLLNAIRKHIRDDSEIVRADFVELLGSAVQHWKSESMLRNMEPLLVNNDEEASFFTNILHIQQHRRTRAIRRLVAEIETGAISAVNIAEYFLPLLQKFVDDDSTGDSAQATKGQSIASLTTLLQWLDWKSFRGVFRHYRQALERKTEDDKFDVRLLNHAADALTVAITRRSNQEGDVQLIPHLARTLPSDDVITQELKNHFVPKLADLSHYKDEGEISQRIPAAVVAVKLVKLLPDSDTAILAAPIVLDVAQVLRSRTQETRDLARNQLAEMVKTLGSSSIQFVLKELRTALTRGYQLHVLSYALHTILLKTADQRNMGDLDYCLEDLVKVILDDVFGAVGQEKENQDYISSMKEVKSNKSFDSMEILAKCTSVRHLSKLVLPFEPLLTGSLTSKQIRHVDELFRRVGVGILHSPSASSQDLLVFAFELIQSFYKVKPVALPRKLTNDERNRDRFIVQKDNVKRVGSVTSSSLLYKLAKFAIDIARSTFARHSELMTSENVHGFIPIIGDALVEAQEDVKISAMRLLSTVIKLKMPDLEESAKLYVIEAVRVVRGAISTNEEGAQAALKVVAAILREKHDVVVRESDVAYLLKRTMPDLEEPDRQGVTFNFVKAVMARQMQMPEVYELVDKLGLMMVTSQSRNSRDAARGVYVHFLLDYPQGKARWSKQVKFLVKNLEYQYPEGRQSIMEAASVLITKIDGGTARELSAMMFIPIVLRMANDDNERCREMAAALLAQLFQRTPVNGKSAVLEPLRAWLEQDDNHTLQKISLQAWSIYFKSIGADAQSDVPLIRERLIRILRGQSEDNEDWEVKYLAAELVEVLVKQFPGEMLTENQKALWQQIIATLQVDQPWLQQSSSNLIASFFRECIEAGSTTVPLMCKQGLSISEETIIALLRSSVRILKHQTTGVELTEAVTQNVLFLARCAETSGTRISVRSDIDAEEEESDMEGGDTAIRTNGHAHTNGDGISSTITASQYIIDQAARTLRREPPKQTTAALRPKLAFLNLITSLIPHQQSSTITDSRPSITALLVPMLHYTSTTIGVPRSIDPTFATTYQTLIEQSQVCLDTLQSTLGDQRYMKCVTAASKQAREKRQDRRSKRALDTIAEPERAAKEKRRKFEKKKERRKEISGIHRGNRRKDLGF